MLRARSRVSRSLVVVHIIKRAVAPASVGATSLGESSRTPPMMGAAPDVPGGTPCNLRPFVCVRAQRGGPNARPASVGVSISLWFKRSPRGRSLGGYARGMRHTGRVVTTGLLLGLAGCGSDEPAATDYAASLKAAWGVNGTSGEPVSAACVKAVGDHFDCRVRWRINGVRTTFSTPMRLLVDDGCWSAVETGRAAADGAPVKVRGCV